MTNDEVRELVKSAVSDAVKEVVATPDIHCRYKFEAVKHDEEHEAIRKFIRLMSRVEDMKWSVLQKIVIGMVGLAFTLMVYGALAKLQIFGGFGWPGK